VTAEYVFYGGPGVRNWIDGRIRRITGLLRRIDTLPLRTDFDPAKFDPADFALSKFGLWQVSASGAA